MKLGLGTVQFGIDYGISNRGGQTTVEEVSRILDVAERNGIQYLDTAALYGNSEEVLGKVLPEGHSFRIVTKTPKFSSTTDSLRPDLLEKTFKRSLKHLGSRSLYGLLVHHAEDLLDAGGEAVFSGMQRLKQEGLVEKIGVSVYSAHQIDRVLDRFLIDLIQVPVNVLDQRLLQSGHLSKMKSAGIEVHSRSSFLQGLLLMDPVSLPSYFNSVLQHLTRYQELIFRIGLSPVQAALGFVTGLKEIDTVFCGVNTREQLEELCRSLDPLNAEQFSGFAVTDENIVDPSRWKL